MKKTILHIRKEISFCLLQSFKVCIITTKAIRCRDVTIRIFLMVINFRKISSNNYNQSTISMRETRTLACTYKKENRFLGVFLDGRTEDPGCLMTVLYTDMTLTIDLATGCQTSMTSLVRK